MLLLQFLMWQVHGHGPLLSHAWYAPCDVRTRSVDCAPILLDVLCRAPLQPACSHRTEYLDAVYDHGAMRPLTPSQDVPDSAPQPGGGLPFGSGAQLPGSSTSDGQRSPAGVGANPYDELPARMLSPEAFASEGAHRTTEPLNSAHSRGWTAAGLLPDTQQHVGSRVAAGLSALLPSPDGTPWQDWLASKVSWGNGGTMAPSGADQAGRPVGPLSSTREGGIQGGLRARYGMPVASVQDAPDSPQSAVLDPAADASPSRLIGDRGGLEGTSTPADGGPLPALPRHATKGSNLRLQGTTDSLPNSQQSVMGACVPVKQGAAAVTGLPVPSASSWHPQGDDADVAHAHGTDEAGPVLRFSSTPPHTAARDMTERDEADATAPPTLPQRCAPHRSMQHASAYLYALSELPSRAFRATRVQFVTRHPVTCRESGAKHRATYLDAVMSLSEDELASPTIQSQPHYSPLPGSSGAARRPMAIFAQPCVVAEDGQLESTNTLPAEEEFSDKVLPAAVILDAAGSRRAASGVPGHPVHTAASILRALARVLSGDSSASSPARQRTTLQAAIINGQSPADAQGEAVRSRSLPVRVSRAVSSATAGLISAASSLAGGVLRMRRTASHGESVAQVSAHRSPLQGKQAMGGGARMRNVLVQQSSSVDASGSIGSTGSRASSRTWRSLLVQPSSASVSADRGVSCSQPAFEQHVAADAEQLPPGSMHAQGSGRRRRTIVAVQRSADSTGSIAGSISSRQSGRAWLMQPNGDKDGAARTSSTGSQRRRAAIYVQRSSASSSGLSGDQSSASLQGVATEESAPHLRGKIYGAGSPRRQRTVLAVQQSTASDGRDVSAVPSSASAARRRGLVLDVQRSSDSVSSADASDAGSARRRPQLLVQQSEAERAAVLQHSRSSESAAGTLGFWDFASRLMGYPSTDALETGSTMSSASSRSRSALVVQSSSASVTAADRAASIGSQPPSTSGRRSVTSVHSGRSAKRAVLIVQSSSPSTSDSSARWLSRGRGSSSVSRSSASGGRRPQLLQIGRSASILSSDSDLLRAASSRASSVGSRRGDLVQVARSDSVTQADAAQARGLTAQGRRSHRQRPLVAKPGMGRSRRNYGFLVQTSSDSVLAESIRSDPPATGSWEG